MNKAFVVIVVLLELFLFAGCAGVQSQTNGQVAQMLSAEKAEAKESKAEVVEVQQPVLAKEITHVKTAQWAEEPKKQVEASDKKVQALPKINLTPLTSVAETATQEESKRNLLSNSYTRLVITSSGIGDGELNLDYRKEGLLKRFLWGTKYDFNLTAHITIDSYETTVPLLSITHQSDSNGEQWLRSIAHDLLGFPLFLVKGDGSKAIPRVEVTLRGTKENSSHILTTALQVAVAGIQQVSPEAKLLTTLTANASKEKAIAIDNAIGKLFAQGIQEKHSDDRDFNRWVSGKGWQISLKMPTTEKDWDKNMAEVGTWTITFADPQPSIFSDWRICGNDNDDTRCASDRPKALDKVYADLNPARVLSYELARKTDGKPSKLSDYISQKDYYQSALTNFDGKAVSDMATADNLCRMLLIDIADLGLNAEDASIIAWAVINGMPQPKNKHSEAYNAEACKPAKTVADKIKATKTN